jgi:hypothetical protein
VRRSAVLEFQEMRKRTQGITTIRCATDHQSAVQISRLPLSQRTICSRIQLTYLPPERKVTETYHIIGY